MNNKYRKNIEKQKEIDEKIKELELKKEILKEYRSIDISIDEFLEMIKSYKKDELKEKRSMQKAENIEYMEENDEDQI